jgi:hypothetical protein
MLIMWCTPPAKNENWRDHQNTGNMNRERAKGLAEDFLERTKIERDFTVVRESLNRQG